MLNPRRIPVLQILNRRLVKTIKFSNPQYIGDPLNAVRIFNAKEVDELIIMDISPERFKTGPDFEMVEMLLSECQMPVGYGGGIRSVSDANKLFHYGAEKLVINTLAFDKPKEVLNISQLYGSQAISFSIDYKLNILKQLVFFKNSSLQKTFKSIEKLVELINYISCGEVILHDIIRDGKFCGYSYELLKVLRDKITVPIVVLGGARNINDFTEAVSEGAHSTAASSMYIYQGPHKAVLIQY